MKKLLLTLAFILAALPALFAQDGRSIVRVRLSDNTPLIVTIDGKSFGQDDKIVTADNITAGRHKLKVFVPATSGRERRALVYEGDFKVQPNTHSYIIVDRFKATTRITSGSRESMDRDVRYPVDRVKHPSNRGNNYNNNDDDRGYRNDRHTSRNAFSPADMRDLNERVEDRMHSDGKVKLMKSVLVNRTYTTDQVRTMLSWLTFDDSKLEFAKWAYTNVIDKRNYWKLDNAFTFSSSKEDFNDYFVARR
jgi:hypothetical protein